ncbi:MAG TPA: hypothetical protein ENN12_03300 [Epsilonproteobacteria bacterium]|nr:hypothetical protein [Campylobacterota bacterium]
MKYLIFLIGFVGLIGANSLSVEEIENKIVKIDGPRSGINLATLDNVSDPFVYPVVVSQNDENSTSTKRIVLSGLMNNRAYINDNWVKVGDDVMGYKVGYIGKNGVILNKGSKVKKLFLKEKKKSLIQFKEGGR